MASIEINPAEDGVTHINVYTKGKTNLGRALTNFADIGFSHKHHGDFDCVEGYWYWLRLHLLGSRSDEMFKLHNSDGYTSKQLGLKLLKEEVEDEWVDFPEEEFRKGIIAALDLRFRQCQMFREDFMEEHLPLKHYYVYGKADNYIVREAGHAWVLDGLELLRHQYRCSNTRCYIFRVLSVEGVIGATAYCSIESIKTLYRVYYLLMENVGNKWSQSLEDAVRVICKESDRDEFSDAVLETDDVWNVVSNIFRMETNENTVTEVYDTLVVTDRGLEVTRNFLK